MAQAHDTVRVLLGKINELRHGFLLQLGLVCHLKHHGVAVLQGRQADADGLALPQLRMGIGQGSEPVLACELFDFRVLGYHHHPVQLLAGNGRQGALDQREPVCGRLCQFVSAEAAAKACGHQNAADLHVQHSFPVVYPDSVFFVNALCHYLQNRITLSLFNGGVL